MVPAAAVASTAAAFRSSRRSRSMGWDIGRSFRMPDCIRVAGRAEARRYESNGKNPSNVEAAGLPRRLETANEVAELGDVVVGGPDPEDHEREPRETVPHRDPSVVRMRVWAVAVAGPAPDVEGHEDQPQHHQKDDDADPVRKAP